MHKYKNRRSLYLVQWFSMKKEVQFSEIVEWLPGFRQKWIPGTLVLGQWPKPCEVIDSKLAFNCKSTLRAAIHPLLSFILDFTTIIPPPGTRPLPTQIISQFVSRIQHEDRLSLSSMGEETHEELSPRPSYLHLTHEELSPRPSSLHQLDEDCLSGPHSLSLGLPFITETQSVNIGPLLTNLFLCVQVS